MATIRLHCGIKKYCIYIFFSLLTWLSNIIEGSLSSGMLQGKTLLIAIGVAGKVLDRSAILRTIRLLDIYAYLYTLKKRCIQKS